MPVIVTWQTSASTIRKQNIDWGGGTHQHNVRLTNESVPVKKCTDTPLNAFFARNKLIGQSNVMQYANNTFLSYCFECVDEYKGDNSTVLLFLSKVR